MDNIQVIKISKEEDLATAHEIRRLVFVIEQNCPPELEWEHEEDSVHFLAFLNGTPCGTARWRQTDKGYKLERFAVLKEFRGRGVAGALIKTVLEDLPKDRALRYLNAQLDAIPVYAKFGFRPKDELFEEAGIMHRQMTLVAD
jgi:predicted GNAT family N-acyltransferase